MSSYGQWKGIPREKIPWYLTVDAEKCMGCKECFNLCRHKVYAWDENNNKTKVTEPYHCVVGCSTCLGLCNENAILFLPLTILKDFAK